MTAADQLQRTAALNPLGSCIVQAPAGSGKTEILTQRFLKLLAQVDKPEQVLAITFTRKATQEMRERILHRLRQAEEGIVPVQAHELLAVDFAATVLARDNKLGWNLRKNPARLQIHTIDGLCSRIAGRSPETAQGLAGMRVIEDATPLYLKAAGRLVVEAGTPQQMPEAHQALVEVLCHLHGNTVQLVELLAQMLSQRDQWQRRMAFDPSALRGILAHRQEIELEHLVSVLGSNNINDLTSMLALLAADAEDTGLAEEFLQLQDGEALQAQEPESRVRSVLASLRLVATKAHAPYSPRSAGKVLPGDSEQRDEQLARIREILTYWHGDERCSTIFTRFVAKPPLEDGKGQLALLESLRLLLKYATAELHLHFAEEGQADFQHFANMAMLALGDESEPGEALLAEDSKLAHILMDEFQDTSRSQYRLLRRLVSGWQQADGRTLFLVGDPMQSIYRFRQADVSLFNRVAASGRLGDVALELLRLSSNFRSNGEIIHWVNSQFERIFSMPAGPHADAVDYAPVQAERGQGGCVRAIAWHKDQGDDEEARQITDLIGQKLADKPDADIAVLARKRKQLTVIARALQKRNIPFDAVQVEPLDGRPVVQDLLSFTRAILHPCDRIAWLALLRGPWCGLDIPQLHRVAGEDPEADLLLRMASASVLEALPEEQSKRVKTLHVQMSSILQARGRVPLHRLVEVAWLRCKAPFAAGSQLELENAQLFFDLLATVESEHADNQLEVLQERLKGAYSGSGNANVKLMTIHKAKGLEFDVVILPGLHAGTRAVDRPLLRLQEVPGEEAGSVLMAPMKRRGFQGNSLYDYLGLLETEAQACESQRTLYVAATRARDELYLSGAWYMKGSGKNRIPGCDKGSFMEMLWPCFEAEVDVESLENEIEATQEPVPLLPQLSLHNAPDLTDFGEEQATEEASIELRIPDRNAVALGEALHLWLELIHNHWQQGWSRGWFENHTGALESSLRRAGAEENQMTKLVIGLQEMILETLESKESDSVLCPQGKKGSWAELALYRHTGVHLQKHILDRLYINREGEYVVVDYKTGSGGEEAHLGWAAQLETYRSIVELCTGAPVSVTRIYKPEENLSIDLGSIHKDRSE